MLFRKRPLLAVIFAFSFIAVTALLTRSLAATGTERASVLRVLQAQVNGDVDAVLTSLPACKNEPRCIEMTHRRVKRLQRRGRVEILNYQPSARIALMRQTSSARVAWRVGTEFPIVQCVRVHREGPLSSNQVELIAVSDPIDRQASCVS